MSYTFTQQARLNILNLIAGAGGANLQVRLYKNNIITSVTTQVMDIVEANFDGYAAMVSSVWSAPAADGAGDVFILSPTFVWQKTAGIVPNTIYGNYVTYDDGSPYGLLIAVESFTVAMPMIATTDQIPLRVLLSTRNLVA